jgi:putative endonuclease
MSETGRKTEAAPAPRASTSEKGARGEAVASDALEAVGMTVIARNWRARGGEIDIVAIDGSTIVFVEVKSWTGRYGMEDAEMAIGPFKRARIAETAKHFLAANRQYNRSSARFDVIYVRNGEAIKHVRGAFDA